MDRREFLKLSSLAAAGLSSFNPRAALAAGEGKLVKGDFKLHVGPISLEIGPGKIIKTFGYDGSAPGPVLRFTEGKPVTVDVFNESDVPETVHWHGQVIPTAADGSTEEGTPA